MEALGGRLPMWTVAPFVLLLAAVAVLEVLAAGWWSRLTSKALVVTVLAVPAAVQLLIVGGAGALTHSVAEYVSFVSLLAALFVISGGIEVRGSLAGTPLANAGMLAVGAVLANVIGTTGAAMLLIRPFLRANARRGSRAHLVVFFILIVANAGGLLTPIGDPPLYLGFLKGVPFEWTFRLWAPWLFVNGVLILVFNLVDQFLVNREERRDRNTGLLDELITHQPLSIGGRRNVLLLTAVVLVLLAKGALALPFGVPEATLLAIAYASYRVTPRAIHEANHFGFGPIASVAVIFAGVFVTMTQPLLILNARAAQIGLEEPWQFFWASGGLSSVLDNAPTYLAFTSVAAGQLGISVDDPRYLAALVDIPAGNDLLFAIACGAVMMGSLTYIGNGPNLMVKEVAEHRGVRMPHFFAYALIAMLIMLPVLAAATFLFFSPG
ncbi:Na+/H+ antiporter NhaD/arsenite permease-like protein [Actinoplanes lutulentus]|uniref:UIT6 family transporter n=1 Tax=Actinoplanes lutulentus TaxID=1287878 RepID=A0A327Z6G1_9ACTN|nr:sodium:proton antiporter [Actinoplanes lutulentus]MBB2946558.1 Na+/H+ antiporter NhaD/arsenite permease-like protein [Actinoplanes lutulentus]RAK26476.1 UIT6 family transporter [Actinoplanes lutulentus]